MIHFFRNAEVYFSPIQYFTLTTDVISALRRVDSLIRHYGIHA
jgi:hypothetical protein